MGVYLDYNAATPIDPRVRHAMENCSFGNASSRDHAWGWEASARVEHARGDVAELAGAQAVDVTFGSGASEALSTVLRSFWRRPARSKTTFVTSAVDHEAILGPSRYLHAAEAVKLKILPVDQRGHVDLDAVRVAVDDHPQVLVALGIGNSEIGTVASYRDIASVVRASEGLILWDTTQAWGKLPLELTSDLADFATISAHKCYGPTGTGALLTYCAGVEIEPLIPGGGQERGRRGGTLNVSGIVGLGEACRLVQANGVEDSARVRTLRDYLEHSIEAQLDDTWVNGDRANRLCNTSNMGFKGVDARTLIRDMHDIAVSTKSACSSGDSRPSHVLKAIGLSDEDAFSCIRFSLGRFTTEDEIDYTINKVVTSVHKLRRNKSVRM